MIDDPPPNGPLSWRDVYRAVNDAETRILAAINGAIAPIANTKNDHEDRLRKIEQGELPWVNKLAEDANRTHTDQGRRLGEVEDAVSRFSDREEGVIGTVKAIRWIILAIASLAVAVVSVISNVITIAAK